MANKPSPLKGADPVLVKGAYDAAGNELYQKYVQMQHDRLMQIVKDVSSWNFGTGAQRIIDANGKLPSGIMGGVRDNMSGPMRKKYIEGNNKTKEEVLREVQEDAQEVGADGQWEQIRLNFANQFKAKNFSNAFERTDEGKELIDIFLGEDQFNLEKKKCPEGVEDCENKGRYGIYMTDHKLIRDTNKAMVDVKQNIKALEDLYKTGGIVGDGSDLDALYEELEGYEELVESNPKIWTSKETIASMLILKDQNSMNLLESGRSGAYNKGKDLLPEDQASFNRDKAFQVMNDVVMPQANMMSLVYDPMWGNYSYYDNLQKHIMENTYADFGVPKELVDAGDQNMDGKISQEEAQFIANEFVGDIYELENNQALRENITEYHVQNWENNYNLGTEDRRDSYLVERNDEGDFVSSKNYMLGTDELGKPITETTTDESTNEPPVDDDQRLSDNTGIINDDVEDVGQDEDEDEEDYLDKRDQDYEPQSVNTDWA